MGTPKIVNQVSDMTVSAPGGRTLQIRCWLGSNPRGVLLISHGFGEHGGSYRHVAEALGPALGVDVAAHDFHGHGRSTGRRGVVRRYEDLVDDLRSVVAWAKERWTGLPIFLFGHSNGGQVVLRYAVERGEGNGIAGVIVSNPSLRIAMPVPALKLALGRLLLRLAPWATLRAFETAEGMTRDPLIWESQSRDPLRHNRISPPFYFGMVAGGAMLLARAEEMRSPLLMILGGRDPVVDGAAAREFLERASSPDKTLLVYPEMLHEPLNEIGRERVFADIADWLGPRLGAPPVSPSPNGPPAVEPVRPERTDVPEGA